jgi:dolichol-phosphate mannosyltransferase
VRDPRLAVVTPTLNEVGNIGVLVSKLLALQPCPSVYVMDDASTDGTLESLEALSTEQANLHLVRRAGPRGYGRACTEGLERAVEEGAELVLQMDADLSHDPCTGFRLWRGSLLERLALGDIGSDGYAFLVETLFRASRIGARITEIPIIFVERESGESKLSRKVFLESALLPWRLTARRLFSRPR